MGRTALNYPGISLFVLDYLLFKSEATSCLTFRAAQIVSKLLARNGPDVAGGEQSLMPVLDTFPNVVKSEPD